MGTSVRKKYNFGSPRTILTACDFGQLPDWCMEEAKAIPERPIRDAVKLVLRNLNSFVRWPQEAMLLWEGESRLTKYHQYPAIIKLMALDWQRSRQVKIPLDCRVNGPAVAAFLLAGGERPPRFGSSNKWSVHHIYSGKFPYIGKSSTLHAASHGLHCTQSAGLVAIHPIADQMCDEFPAFTWLLRAEAFLRFAYDPDEVFTEKKHDDYGFSGKKCRVIRGLTVVGPEK